MSVTEISIEELVEGGYLDPKNINNSYHVQQATESYNEDMFWDKADDFRDE